MFQLERRTIPKLSFVAYNFRHRGSEHATTTKIVEAYLGSEIHWELEYLGARAARGGGKGSCMV
jgi:hypothetical protein